jgi:hypothetical protein
MELMYVGICDAVLTILLFHHIIVLNARENLK